MSELERLPHLAPYPNFAERVMSRVQVFEPWHVAATDSVRRWVPRSGPARALAGGFALGGAVSLSLATLWIVTRLDAAVFFADLLLTRVRIAALSALGDVVGALFGQPALDALRAGGASGVALVATSFLVALAVALLGLRLASAASRRRRA